MRKKIKSVFKNRVFVFVLGIFVCGTIGVYAATYFPSNDVTYDNSVSGLKSTNVQGAIDELYSECNSSSVPGAGGEILDKVTTVSSGDGLYAEDIYIYKGANPNNYITFNGEKAGWRIISIENDGTIKIIRNTTLGIRVWDSSNSIAADWARPSTLSSYLNSTYYNSLNTAAKNQIISHYWLPSGTTGKVSKNKIAIITLSEYFRVNSNINNCGTLVLYNYNVSVCETTNWLYNLFISDSSRSGIYVWTRTILDDLSGELEYVYRINLTSGEIIVDLPVNGHSHVYPVLYLSSDVKITGGTGTQSDPYTIS